MLPFYDITIHENPNGSGMKLTGIETKILNYLDRKKAKEPESESKARAYTLRNGLNVTIYPAHSNGVLQMRVTGDVDKINKSIEAIEKIYAGKISIGKSYPVEFPTLAAEPPERPFNSFKIR